MCWPLQHASDSEPAFTLVLVFIVLLLSHTNKAINMPFVRYSPGSEDLACKAFRYRQANILCDDWRPIVARPLYPKRQTCYRFG